MQSENNAKTSISIINGEKAKKKEIVLPSNLTNETKDLHILYIKNDEVFFILQSGDFNGDKLVKYDLKTGFLSHYNLLIDYDKKVFTPSEEVSWPNGVIYSRLIDYMGMKAVFALFMDKNYIYLYKFDISSFFGTENVPFLQDSNGWP